MVSAVTEETGTVIGIVIATATEMVTAATATEIGTGIETETVLEEGRNNLANDIMTVMVMTTHEPKGGIRDLQVAIDPNSGAFGGYLLQHWLAPSFLLYSWVRSTHIQRLMIPTGSIT